MPSSSVLSPSSILSPQIPSVTMIAPRRAAMATTRIGATVGAAMQTNSTTTTTTSTTDFGLSHVLSLAGVGIGAYHGYRRNDSVGWAIGWALLGGMFPVITIAIALAQGFGVRTKN